MSDTPHKTLLDILPDPGQAAGHAIATGSLLGTLLGYLPTIAAIVAIIWYALAIWEMRTVVGWRSKLAHLFGARRLLDKHRRHGDNP